jgi:hypothetical protein
MPNAFGRSQPASDADESDPGLARPGSSESARPGGDGDRRRRQIRAGQTRLLYENATTGSAATIVIAALLAYAQWDHVPRGIVSAWLTCVVLIAAARFVLARLYFRASPSDTESRGWNTRFVVGTALAAAGWAVGAFTLYPAGEPANQYLMVFTVGGVMLGSGSLLAPRPEAFLTFLVPTGFLTAVHLASEGDETHLIMGLLAAVFTVVTIFTTWRFHRAIESSFHLRFDNDALIGRLRTAMHDAAVLNRELELRPSCTWPSFARASIETRCITPSCTCTTTTRASFCSRRRPITI